MMRAESLNWHGYGGYIEMTDLSSNICSTDKNKSKCIIMHKTLSQICSAKEDESKHSIVNKTLSQNYSTEANKLRSTEEDK